MPDTAWLWLSAFVERVVDGDTLDSRLTRTVTMDFGFGLRPSMTLAPLVRLRVNKINAAKGSSDLGKQATAMVEQLTAGVPLTIVTWKPYKYGGPADSPGEWMADFTLPDGTDLAGALVAAGLAVWWSGQGPRPGG